MRTKAEIKMERVRRKNKIAMLSRRRAQRRSRGVMRIWHAGSGTDSRGLRDNNEEINIVPMRKRKIGSRLIVPTAVTGFNISLQRNIEVN